MVSLTMVVLKEQQIVLTLVAEVCNQLKLANIQVDNETIRGHVVVCTDELKSMDSGHFVARRLQPKKH